MVSGRIKTGEIIYQGFSLDGDDTLPHHMRTKVSFVSQDNYLCPTMSVEENIEFSMSLREPGSELYQKKSRADKQLHASQHVDKLLRDFNLSHCRSTRVGDPATRGISGGERKRTAIAMELAVLGKIIVLDEPTSSLDSATSFQVIELLKAFCLKHGSTVVLSIHQPSARIWELFDHSFWNKFHIAI